jgi:hypothetical protein
LTAAKFTRIGVKTPSTAAYYSGETLCGSFNHADRCGRARFRTRAAIPHEQDWRDTM